MCFTEKRFFKKKIGRSQKTRRIKVSEECTYTGILKFCMLLSEFRWVFFMQFFRNFFHFIALIFEFEKAEVF